jgi:hypothetical protein
MDQAEPEDKSFLGTSKNAVLTQIWVAMCYLPAFDLHQVPDEIRLFVVAPEQDYP